MGTEPQRNEFAHKVVKKLLEECIWINVHWLPHDEHIVEVIFEESNIKYLRHLIY